jgi:mono/diheme cytochrome c family protein
MPKDKRFRFLRELLVLGGALLLVMGGALLLAGAAVGAAPQGRVPSAEPPHRQAQAAQQHSPGQPMQHAGETLQAERRAFLAAFKKAVPEEYRIMERTPVIDDRESLLRGRSLYMSDCAVCHGPLGRGDGPGAAGMKMPPPDFLDFEHSAQYGPGEKYWIIARGSKKNAQGSMTGFPKMPPKDVWHLVNYILALQAKVKAEGYDKPPHGH